MSRRLLRRGKTFLRRPRLLRDLRVLRLKPGDVVVARVENLPTAALEQIRATLEGRFPDHQVLVVSGKVEMAAIRPSPRGDPRD